MSRLLITVAVRGVELGGVRALASEQRAFGLQPVADRDSGTVGGAMLLSPRRGDTGTAPVSTFEDEGGQAVPGDVTSPLRRAREARVRAAHGSPRLVLGSPGRTSSSPRSSAERLGHAKLKTLFKAFHGR